MDTELLPIVPFGKYKGQPITILLNDIKYLEWCKQQEWFTKYPIVYNICVNQTIISNNIDSNTPDHNKLQNLFLDNCNQLKLLSKLFKIDFVDQLNNLFHDNDFIRCFDINLVPELINKLDNTSIMFEEKFNWDFVLYYKDTQSISITSNLETESIDKAKYKEQFDIEQKELNENFDKNLLLIDNLILARIKLDKKIGKKNYNFCFNKQYSEWEHDYYKKKYFGENDEKVFQILCERPFRIFKKDNCDELDFMSNSFRNAISIKDDYTYDLLYKIDPIFFNKNYPNYLFSVSDLQKSKKEYEKHYIQNYEKKFIEHYHKYRKQYYNNLLSKYIVYDKYDIEITKENQYLITIWICNYECALCCELKPILSDDYPCVLRKLKTQIELTKTNKKYFRNYMLGWILIIGSFTSTSTTKEQLITIFKQSNIKIIFTDEIFE